MELDFLVIGHLSWDVHPQGRRLGGTAAYAALTARGLGLRAGVVTAAGPETATPLEEAGVLVHRLPSPRTTVFQNRYTPRGRRQRLLEVAAPIGAGDVPPAWRRTPLVLLGPIAHEVDPSLAALFPQSLLGVTPQGWFRRWDARGRVHLEAWESAFQVLPHATVVVLSDEEAPDQGTLEAWAARVPLLVVTQGRQGSRLHWRGTWHLVPPFPTAVVDPTGAGDVFAAALLIRYAQTRDPLEAARFASCAASLCVAAPGLAGVPTLGQVEARLRQPLLRGSV